jgi:hypothetical protein
MSSKQADGVPVAQQLTVRDATGGIYLPLQISLRESRFEAKHCANVLREAPAEAFVDGVVWTVFVVVASENDAPAT